ncbi:tripartite tricarboxylate transporter TctB family protein [Methylibium sp.]|uniref:tripartite tricarboxylate transporter TctB family protein n=1 Tax=Methylibium sp. TaxID=2067992 RepID=UPI00286D1AF2|nr:tripartite tricarboxylate transporter TctB family protein [Methylibium sp.]
MKIKSQRDFAAGLMFLVVGIAFAIGATNYTFGSSAKPGAGYFPLLLGVILAVLGALVLFKALTIESEGGDPIGAIAWKPLLLILGAVVVFGATLPRLGMAVAVPLLIIVSSLGGDEVHWKAVVITSVVLTLGSWLVFVKGLGLTIPVWPVFITG